MDGSYRCDIQFFNEYVYNDKLNNLMLSINEFLYNHVFHSYGWFIHSGLTVFAV